MTYAHLPIGSATSAKRVSAGEPPIKQPKPHQAAETLSPQADGKGVRSPEWQVAGFGSPGLSETGTACRELGDDLLRDCPRVLALSVVHSCALVGPSGKTMLR